MTYEEWINSLVPGVQFYDDFRDNGLGVGVPNGWTKMCGQVPEIVADAGAFGGKAVKLYNVGSIPTALAFDAIGQPEGKVVEVLMRLRTDQEFTKQCSGSFDAGLYFGSSPCEPLGPPGFGGPGVRMHYSGSVLRAIAGRGTNRSARCDADMYWGFGPCQGNYRPAAAAGQLQAWQVMASRDTGVFEIVFGPVGATIQPHAHGGHVSQFSLFFSGGGAVRPNNVLCPSGGAVISVDCPEEGQFGVGGVTSGRFGLRRGNTQSYGLMRLRIGRNPGPSFRPDALQFKWWPCSMSEPLSWLTIEDDILTAVAPPPSGFVGIAHIPHPNMSDLFTPHTYVDYVSVSLSPDDLPAAQPPDMPLPNCPLPNGEVGVAYFGTLDPNGSFQNP